MRLPKHTAATTRPSALLPVRAVATIDPWEKLDELSMALASQRTEVLRRLAKGEIRVSDLAEELDLSRNDVSYHLAPLRALGFVEYVRKGRDLVYRLGPNARLVRRRRRVVLRLVIADVCQVMAQIEDPETDLSPRKNAPQFRLTSRPA